jgi:hypothetical protein
VLEKELEWRKSTGRTEGYGTMRKTKPIVAVGPAHPLEEEELMADYFRGYFPWGYPDPPLSKLLYSILSVTRGLTDWQSLATLTQTAPMGYTTSMPRIPT